MTDHTTSAESVWCRFCSRRGAPVILDGFAACPYCHRLIDPLFLPQRQNDGSEAT